MPEPLADKPQPHRRRNPALLALLVPLLPVLAAFLGGSTTKWAEGIVLSLLGLLLIFRPPRLSLGTATNLTLLLFALLCAVVFLPATWFHQPWWRAALLDDFQVKLATMVSPQPWITAGAFVSLVGGLCWLYFVCTQELDLRGVRFQVRTFASGVVVLAAASILLYFAHAGFLFWVNTRGFGPFPNKNQTADLFGITSIMVLVCIQDDWRFGRKRWILWVVALAVLVAAILLNFSRAGLGILVGGSAVWAAAVVLRQRTSARIAISASFLLLLLTAVLLLGGETLERFNLRGVPGASMSSDFRFKIFHDTFDMIRANPWCGTGLGNFDAVFPFFRNASAGNTRALHPESDWLWLWAEAGWPAVLTVVIGAALLVRRVLPLEEGTNQRFRLAALTAAVMFGLHGLVDVSAHRVGSAWAGIFLLGMALYRPLTSQPRRSLAFLFRLIGLLLLGSGLAWTIATRTDALLPGTVGARAVRDLARTSNRSANFNETIRLTTTAIDWAPLDWQLYFLRALAEVPLKRFDAALDDFRRARFLEPSGYDVPLTEGNVWLQINPALAATAWREALRRASGDARSAAYSNMLSGAFAYSKQLTQILEDIGLAEPDLALAYFNRVSGDQFDAAMTRLLQKNPSLTGFTDPQRLALFSIWSERGNLDRLLLTVQQHPDWLRYGWFGVAKFHASKGDFRAAFEMTRQFGEPVALPRTTADGSIEQLQQRYVTNPDNPAIGYALYREQMARDRLDDALVTVRHFSERPNAPAYFHYLEAEGWARKQNWERAWDAWLAYRNALVRK